MDGILDQQTGGPANIAGFGVLAHQEAPGPEVVQRQRPFLDGLEAQMAEHEAAFAKNINALKNSFIFNDPGGVETFIRNHRAVVSILLEAAPVMKECFGDNVPLALDLTSEDGPPRLIYALGMWDGDSDQARAALEAFEEKWGVGNSRKAGGRIVFDYQLV
jgi:hypothetical protein